MNFCLVDKFKNLPLQVNFIITRYVLNGKFGKAQYDFERSSIILGYRDRISALAVFIFWFSFRRFLRKPKVKKRRFSGSQLGQPGILIMILARNFSPPNLKFKILSIVSVGINEYIYQEAELWNYSNLSRFVHFEKLEERKIYHVRTLT